MIIDKGLSTLRRQGQGMQLPIMLVETVKCLRFGHGLINPPKMGRHVKVTTSISPYLLAICGVDTLSPPSVGQ